MSQSGYLLADVEHWNFRSDKNGRTYQIMVSRPSVPPPSGGYPAVFLTDANLMFATMVEQATVRAISGELHHAVIVGLGYATTSPETVMKERMIDFAPAEMNGLYAVLLQEVLPTVTDLYAINPDKRSLFGFSLGGLFALNVFLRGNGEFGAFMAASPSIWCGEETLIRLLETEDGANEPRSRLLITVGSLEQSTDHVSVPHGMPYEQAVEQVKAAAMVDKVTDMVARFRQHVSHEDQLHFLLLEGETHSSAPAASIGRALGFALSCQDTIHRRPIAKSP